MLKYPSMIKGIKVRILGDAGPFSKMGKSIGYSVTIGRSHYLIDCGAALFQQIGGHGLKDLQGLIITHCHDDHKRWFTDMAIFYRYARDITGSIPLFASEDVRNELCSMSKPALDRTLSDDSRRIVDIRCGDYIDYNTLGPEARYKIIEKDEDEGRYRLCITDEEGREVGSDRARIVISELSGRARMLFKDPDYNEWVEPESFYSFSSDIFYKSDKNIFRDPEGFTIEALKAPVWHGIPNIGIRFRTLDETLVFSSDTVHDTVLWKDLCDIARSPIHNPEKGEFADRQIIRGDINEFIERTWSKERYADAVSAFNDSVVVHDVSIRDSVVHTGYDKLSHTTLKKDKTLLTHSPDRMTSEWALCRTEKNYIVRNQELFEVVDGKLFSLNADIYHKEEGKSYVGYRSSNGRFIVYERDNMLRLSEVVDDALGILKFRVDLYEDIEGRYLPMLEGKQSVYRKRRDGNIECLQETEQGSSAVIVRDCRGDLSEVHHIESNKIKEGSFFQ